MTDARFGKAMPDPIIGGIGGAIAGWLITLLAFLVSNVPNRMLAKTRTYPGANGRTQEKQNRLKAGFIVTSRMASSVSPRLGVVTVLPREHTRPVRFEEADIRNYLVSTGNFDNIIVASRASGGGASNIGVPSGWRPSEPSTPKDAPSKSSFGLK